MTNTRIYDIIVNKNYAQIDEILLENITFFVHLLTEIGHMYGDMDIFEYLYVNKNQKIFHNHLRIICRYNRHDIITRIFELKLFSEKDFLNKECLYDIIDYESIEVLKLLNFDVSDMQKFYLFDYISFCCQKNKLIINYLINDAKYDVSKDYMHIYTNMCKHGILTITKYTNITDYIKKNKPMCGYENKHVHVIKYLHKQCEYGKTELVKFCKFALATNNVRLLKYFHAEIGITIDDIINYKNKEDYEYNRSSNLVVCLDVLKYMCEHMNFSEKYFYDFDYDFINNYAIIDYMFLELKIHYKYFECFDDNFITLYIKNNLM